MERQESEILALSSIYDETCLLVNKDVSSGIYSGSFFCHVHFDTNVLLCITEDGQMLKSAEVKVLPPIRLKFSFRDDYPQNLPPDFTLSCDWLTPSQLIIVRDKLLDLFAANIGQEILFIWFGFLESEACRFLDGSSSLDLTAVQNECTNFRTSNSNCASNSTSIEVSSLTAFEILRQCQDYDTQMEADELSKRIYDCSICLLEKSGKFGAMFGSCRHMFCKTCLAKYFESKIADNEVRQIICPSVKCDTIAAPSLLRAVLSDEIFKRYDYLMLNLAIDSMKNVTYCPRPTCQYPVIFDDGERNGICPSCSLSFCNICRAVYHGVIPCRLSLEDAIKLREKWRLASDPERFELTKWYGETTIKSAIAEVDSMDSITSEAEDYKSRDLALIQLYSQANESEKKALMKQYGQKCRIKAEFMSASYLATCKHCPDCKMPCVKDSGCDRVFCPSCNTHFCWRCEKKLSLANLYSHITSGTCNTDSN